MILGETAGLQERLGDNHAQLLLMRGTDEPSQPRGPTKADAERPARELSADLANVPRLQVTFKRFEGLGHGPMLPASLQWVIEGMSKM
ncbi:hypothetical protein D3C77_687030 [compost metagenome]